MTHEQGIEAARRAYSTSVGCNDTPHMLDGWIEDALSAAIAAYLSASGQVLVPAEPSKEMIDVYRANVKPRPFYRTAARVVRAIIAAAQEPTNG